MRTRLPAGRTEPDCVYLVGDRGVGWRATGSRLQVARGPAAPPRPGLAGSPGWVEGQGKLEGLGSPIPGSGVVGEGPESDEVGVGRELGG